MLNMEVTTFGRSSSGAHQTDRYVIPRTALSLFTDGVRSYSIRGQAMDPQPPFLVLHPPLTPVEIGNTVNRASWSLQVDTDEIRATEDPAWVEVLCGDEWVRVQAITKLSNEACTQAEAEFRRLEEWLGAATPEYQFRARVGFIGLLRFILDAPVTRAAKSPIALFKQAVDQDVEMLHSLTDLSRRCGMSPNHMRVLFKEEYGVAPLTYRNRLRMRKALSWVRLTSIPFKRIAYDLGFCDPAHFSRLFRQAHGKSPREAREEARKSMLSSKE